MNSGPDMHAEHVPVMIDEVLRTLAPADGEIYVDCTFGAGGYTRAILDAADCTVCAVDRDPEAFRRARELKKTYGDRLVPLHGCFGDVAALLENAGIGGIDGMVLDLGVSSMQLDTAERGFSFRHDGPLDMRMGQDGPDAADAVNTLDERELADVIYRYGEEKASRRIARAIVEKRGNAPLKTTGELRDAVHEVKPRRPQDKTDPATKTFQALRIYVNDELGELERALAAAAGVLSPGGRLVVVTFHSLEDFQVKNFFKIQSGHTSNASRHMPPKPGEEKPPLFTVPKRKGLEPSQDEIGRNPRARSARLRWGIRTDAPAPKAAEGAS